MNLQTHVNRINPAAGCAALALVAGLAASAHAIDRSWNCNGGAWTTDGCWTPFGRPGNLDVARFGDLPGVQNVIVHLDANEVIAGLHITDGMTFDTDNFTLDVNGNTIVSGRNTVGQNVYTSRLRIDQAVDGPDFHTHNLAVSGEGEVDLNGGGIAVSGVVSIGIGSALRGSGTVQLTGPGTTLFNHGSIVPEPSSLSFAQGGGGRYDLDGANGDGELNLGVQSNVTLAFQGVGLEDTFSSRVIMLSSTVLAMNLTEGWAADSDSVFDIYGAGAGGPSRIAGAPFSFWGTANVYGGANLSLEADTTFQNNSEMVLGNLASVDVSGDAVINGGLFILNNDSNLDFEGATELRGGAFVTFSNIASDGSVDFLGATEWNGTVSVDGIARQLGPATVSGLTVLTIDTFDMDGNANTTWNINQSFVINANRIDTGSSDFSGVLNIAGNGRLAVNLDGVGETWTVSGTMNLSGNNLLFGTKIGNCSPLVVTGDINVSGRNDIFTPTTVNASASIDIPDALSALRFMSSSVIAANVSFSGDGLLQNGGNGDMTLASGLALGSVGLNNTGALRIGSSAGIVSVDRFQTSGEWMVQIGGHNAGAEYDRIVSNGPATLGGTLEVELIDLDFVGGPFVPAVGDTFTILNAVGGVTGSFAPNVTSTVGATTYHWDVIISATDVTIQLASIDSPCAADFNNDGFVNSQDFFDFLTAFFALSAAADVNADAAINSQDFFDFLTAFFNGC